MKRLNYSLMRIVCALIIGLILVRFPAEAENYLVVIVGAVFMIPALFSLAGYFMQRGNVRHRFPVEGIGSLLLGVWLIAMPGFFADVLTVLLGLILAAGGIWQIVSLWLARRWAEVAPAYFIVPILILAVGVTALFNPLGTRSAVMVMIGIGALVYAVDELVNWVRFERDKPEKEGE